MLTVKTANLWTSPAEIKKKKNSRNCMKKKENNDARMKSGLLVVKINGGMTPTFNPCASRVIGELQACRCTEAAGLIPVRKR